MTFNLTEAVDAAMAEAANLHPPLTRSDCARLIGAALGACSGNYTVFIGGPKDGAKLNVPDMRSLVELADPAAPYRAVRYVLRSLQCGPRDVYFYALDNMGDADCLAALVNGYRGAL